MDERITVKFENPAYEIGFKLGAHDQLNNMETIQKWTDAPLLEAVQQTLALLHTSRLAADKRAFPVDSNPEFEAII